MYGVREGCEGMYEEVTKRGSNEGNVDGCSGDPSINESAQVILTRIDDQWHK